MLYNGSLLFLEHDQVILSPIYVLIAGLTVFFLQQISGADLAILLVDVLVKSEEKDYDGWTPKLCKIFSSINASTPERETFLAQALRWSSNHRSFGHPFLHQVSDRIYVNLNTMVCILVHSTGLLGRKELLSSSPPLYLFKRWARLCKTVN